MERYWTNFAKSGDPNRPGLPLWKPWTVDQEPYLQFSQSGDALPQQGFSPPFCHLAPDHLKQQLTNN
jgi:para-nitrobenzyl esterase